MFQAQPNSSKFEIGQQFVRKGTTTFVEITNIVKTSDAEDKIWLARVDGKPMVPGVIPLYRSWYYQSEFVLFYEQKGPTK